MSVLDFDHLIKRYGSTTALRELTLSIPAGSVYGLLGPNGSGKTTSLGLVLGVLRPSGGTVRWFGAVPTAAGRRYASSSKKRSAPMPRLLKTPPRSWNGCTAATLSCA